MRGKVCTVCAHPEVQAINRALYRGGSGVRVIAKQFGFSDHKAVWRHKAKHLPDQTAQAVHQATIETELRVRAALQPKIVLDALCTLYRQLGTCCRPQALQTIQALERDYDVSERMAGDDLRAGSRGLDRQMRQEERIESRVHVIPPSA